MAIGTDYKAIDSDLASDDWQASTLLPHLLRRNLNASIADTHVAGSHYYAQRDRNSGAAIEVPIISTHPDEWWSVPIVVPQCYGAETLHIQLYCEVQTASGGTQGSVKLRAALEGAATAFGSEVTIDESDSKHLTTEFTVACPQVTQPEGVWRGAIQIKSDRLATLDSGGAIRRGDRQFLVIDALSTPAAYATGRGDRFIQVTAGQMGDEDEMIAGYYCGWVTGDDPLGAGSANVAMFHVWPETDPRLQLWDSADETGSPKDGDSVDIIELGAVKVFGYRWRLSGQRDYGLWTNVVMRPGKTMAAMHPLSIDAAQRKLYESRRQVACAGPDNGRGNTGYTLKDRYWHGARFGLTGSAAYEEVASGTVTVREDVLGWVVHVLYLGVPGQEDETIEWQLAGNFPSSSPSQTFDNAGFATPVLHDQGDPFGFLTAFAMGYNPEFWSSADVGRGHEYQRLHYARFRLNRNSNINTGDLGDVALRCKSDIWVGAALIVESFAREG